MNNIAQIRTLRAEARAARDYVQVVICDVALDEVEVDELDENGIPDYSGGGHSAEELRAIRRWLRSSREEAIAECEAVILAGQVAAVRS